MRLSDSFIRTIGDMTLLDDSSNSSTTLLPSLGIDKNNLFNKYLVVDLSKDEIYIPEIVRYYIEQIIKIEVRENKKIYNQVVMPLYENNFRETRRTFDAIIKAMFTSSYRNRLQRVTLSDNSVYFGCKGIILDSQFNPLLLATSKLNREIKDIEITAEYSNRVLYVSPRVFEEPKTLINKNIINKIIPYLSQTQFTLSATYGSVISSGPYEPYTIIVSECIDDFFTCPIAPVLRSDMDNLLNECLINNIEDILQ